MLSLDLVQSAFDFAASMLRPTKSTRSSWFVAKIFTSPEADEWRKEILERHFDHVATEKVAASRKQSREVYWVARGFHLPRD